MVRCGRVPSRSCRVVSVALVAVVVVVVVGVVVVVAVVMSEGGWDLMVRRRSRSCGYRWVLQVRTLKVPQ